MGYFGVEGKREKENLPTTIATNIGTTQGTRRPIVLAIFEVLSRSLIGAPTEC